MGCSGFGSRRAQCARPAIDWLPRAHSAMGGSANGLARMHTTTPRVAKYDSARGVSRPRRGPLRRARAPQRLSDKRAHGANVRRLPCAGDKRALLPNRGQLVTGFRLVSDVTASSWRSQAARIDAVDLRSTVE